MPKSQVTVNFELEKLTPGAARYAEVGADGKRCKPNDEFAKVGTLYVRKRAFNSSSIPEKIKVTIEEV